jgi:general secretion pathway protein G
LSFNNTLLKRVKGSGFRVKENTAVSKAFSLLEVIFVLIILGVLISLNIQNLSFTTDDALFAKAKAQVASIQNGISLQKSKYALKSTTFDIDKLDDSVSYNQEDEVLFSNVLEQKVFSKNKKGYWMKTANNTYIFKVNDTLALIFKYENHKFGCYDYNVNEALDYCKDIYQ